jgi:hypothetical protein
MLAKIEADAGGTKKPYWITEWTNGSREREGGENLSAAFKRHFEKTTTASVPVEMISVVLDTNEKMHNLVDLETYRYFSDISFFWTKIGGVHPNVQVSQTPSGKGLELVWSAENVVSGSCYIENQKGQVSSVPDAGTLVVPMGRYLLACKKINHGLIEKQFNLMLR